MLQRVLSSDWRMRLSFALAGAIFVLCQIIVVGTRSTDNGRTSLARDAGYEDGAPGLNPISPNTDGRALPGD